MTTIVISRQQLFNEIRQSNAILPSNHPFNSLLSDDNLSMQIQPVDWPNDLSRDQLLRSLTQLPRREIITFSVDQIERHQVFEDTGSKLFLISIVGDIVSITDGLDNNDFVNVFVTLLAPNRSAPRTTFLVDLSRSGVSALFAAIDRIRLLVMSSMIERVGLPSVSFRIADLKEQITKAGLSPDYRWLCAMLEHTVGDDAPSAKKTLKDGCNELVEAGLLDKITEGKSKIYIPSPAVVDAALDLLIPQPVIVMKEEGGASRIVCLFSGRSNWSLVTGKTMSSFGSIDGLDAIVAINQNLRIGGTAARETISESESANTQEQATQAPLKMENTATTLPKTEMKIADDNQSIFCKQCGAALQPSKKFCTKCGAKRQQP